jgi:iron complex outermembrane receptor protein
LTGRRQASAAGPLPFPPLHHRQPTTAMRRIAQLKACLRAAPLICLLLPPLAAQDVPATPAPAGSPVAAGPDTTPDNSVVLMDKFVATGEGDPNGFAPHSNTVFGLEKSALDTPRSLSAVSGDMIEKFNISNMTDLERFTPSSFTSFSFGVQSGLSIRGDSSDMYYDGMKMVNNANNLPTPLGPSDGVTIVRGPPSAVYGEGLVGGYTDFRPKSALASTGEYLKTIVGKLTFTTDSVGGKIATAEAGGPLTIFGKKAGFYVYDQDTDSDTWYIGQHVRDETFQGTLTIDLSPKVRFEASVRFYNHNGTGIAGWNRVTQALIDNGVYQTGMENLNLINPGGQNQGYASRVQLYNAGLSNALDFGPGAPTIAKQVAPGTNAYGQLGPNPTGPLALVTDVGTTTLSPRDVLLERVNQGDDYIGLFDLEDTVTPNLTLKDTLFFEHQNYHKFSDISYFREGITTMMEDRITAEWHAQMLPAWMTLSNVAAFNSRFLETQNKSGNVFQLFNYWDLTQYNQGYYAFANGYISPGLAGVDSNALSQHEETGLGDLLDLGFFNRLDLTVGARWDYVNARLDNYPGLSTSSATVLNPSVVVPLVKGHAKASSLTSASLSYKILNNISAYATYATPRSVVPGGTGGLSTAQIQTQILTPSKLQESGIKGEFFDKKLYVTFADFEQLRTAFNANLYGPGDGGLSQTKRNGEEIELRWVPTKYLSVSGAMNWIEEYTNPVLAGFTSTNIITSGLNPILYAGGKYSYGYPASNLYAYAAAPQRQINLFGDYIIGRTGFDVSAGMSRTDAYWADNINDILLPAVLQFSLDVGYRTKTWEYRISGSNLTNQIGFYPTNGGGAVIPNPGRIWTFKLTYIF